MTTPSTLNGNFPNVVVTSLAVAALCLLPLAVVVAASIDVGWDAARALLWRPRVAELLRNTTALVVLTVTAAPG